MSEDSITKELMEDFGTLQKATKSVLDLFSELLAENDELKHELEKKNKQVDLANQEINRLHMRYRQYID